jgi:hypothetical protein
VELEDLKIKTRLTNEKFASLKDTVVHFTNITNTCKKKSFLFFPLLFFCGYHGTKIAFAFYFCGGFSDVLRCVRVVERVEDVGSSRLL